MKIGLLAVLTALLLAGCATEEEQPASLPEPTPATMPTPTPDPTPTPTPTPQLAPSPTPTPTPTPTEAPTQDDGRGLAEEIASRWRDSNAEQIAALVAEAVLASPDVEEKVPALLRVSFRGALESSVADQMGNQLAVSLAEVAYHGDAQYSATLQVQGTMNVDVGPVQAVDLSVPITLMVNVDSERVEDARVDSGQVEVTLR